MIREALVAMGKAHLIGNGPNHLVPPETRNEQNKVKWGQKPSAKAKDQGGQKAMTRFSADQFEDRKGGSKADKSSAKSTGQKPKAAAKNTGQPAKTTGAKRPAKNGWATKSKYAK